MSICTSNFDAHANHELGGARDFCYSVLIMLMAVGMVLGVLALMSGIRRRNWPRLGFAILGIWLNSTIFVYPLIRSIRRPQPLAAPDHGPGDAHSSNDKRGAWHRRVGESKLGDVVVGDLDPAAANNQAALELAVAESSRAIRAKVNSVEAHCNRGIAYFQLGRYDKALADFTAALEIKPDDLPARHNRGQLYIKLKKYQLAIDDLSEAIRLDPNAGVVYWMRGCAHDLRGEIDAALDDFTSAINHDFGTFASFSCRGIMYEKKGEWRKAADDYTEVIKLEPGNPVGYIGRHHCYEKLGETGKANEDAARAKELAPETAPNPGDQTTVPYRDTILYGLLANK